MPAGEAQDRIVLVHISDVHFGDSPLIRHFGFWEGLRPHNQELCQALQLALRDIRLTHERGSPLQLAVSGDLTRTGVPEEFDVALSFLRESRQLVELTSPWGLALDPERVHLIPGNHDHWDGVEAGALQPHRLYNPTLFGGNPFVAHTWARPLLGPNRKLQLDLVGLDSNSGFADARLDPFGRFRALGALSKAALKGIRTELERVVDGTDAGVRVPAVMLHHSLEAGTPLGWLDLGDVASHRLLGQKALLTALDEAAVPVLLTGHMHVSNEPDPHASGPTEIRSASTLQGRPSVQGFWLHEIELRKSEVWWSSTLWDWDHEDAQFMPAQEPIEFQVR